MQPLSAFARAGVPPSLVFAALAFCIVLGLLSAFEAAALGWHPAREEPAAFGAWHLARSLVVASLCAWLVAAASPASPAPLRPAGRAAAAVSLLLGLAFAALFAASPVAFHALSAEDGAVEWASAGLLFLAAFVLAVEAIRRRRARGQAALAAGLAVLFVLIGGEEVSWFQRVAGFDTPAALAERNWQAEFNFHNLHTDLAELAFYSGAGVFLVLLPLCHPVLSRAPLPRFVLPFLPRPVVAAVSAPAAIFTYGHWNLLPVQAVSWLSVLVMAAFARAAARRADRLLFAGLALAVALGQALFLALGARSVYLYDATEFRELFLALGFACYALAARAR